MSHIPIILILWLVFILTLARALHKVRKPNRIGYRLWFMFFLGIFACTLWGESAEMALDRHLYNLPVALYLKYISLIAICHLYRPLLRDVGTLSVNSRLLDYLAPVAISLGILSFFVYIWLEPFPRQDLRYLVIGARDAVILTFILAGFYRGTVEMWLRERVPPMRLKQAFIVLFFSSFAISTVGSIMAAIQTLFQIGDPAHTASVLQPVVYLVIFFFILMLIPYRWYMVLPHVRDLWHYYQLKRLERRVFQLARAKPNHHPLPQIILHAGQLELEIYRTVISILDGYSLLPTVANAHDLTHAIKECVADNPEYSDLIVALTRCTHVRSHS